MSKKVTNNNRSIITSQKTTDINEYVDEGIDKILNNNNKKKEEEIPEHYEFVESGEVSYSDIINFFLPFNQWNLKTWIKNIIYVICLNGFFMKILIFSVWYFSSRDSEMSLDLYKYSYIEGANQPIERNLLDFYKTRYPAIQNPFNVMEDEMIVSSSFWCFWDAGHLILCLEWLLFYLLAKMCWKLARFLVVDKVKGYLKYKIIQNKKRIAKTKTNKITNSRSNKKVSVFRKNK